MIPEEIHDPDDPRVADYRGLKDPDLRRRQGLFVAEGRFVVRRLLTASRFRARSVLMTAAARDGLADALARLDAGTRLYVADPGVIRSTVGFDFHRGCLAVGERGTEPSPDALADPPGRRALVLLEDVADPDNVGAVFRNALAFGAGAVLLSPGAADPLYRKAIRASAAATLLVPFARMAAWPGGLQRLRERGYTIVALVPSASVDVADLGAARAVPERVAVLLGAEGEGLSAASRALADVEAAIAMAPGVDSLNVATASGIALHRLLGPALRRG